MNVTTEQAIEHVTFNLGKAPAQVRSIIEWAMTEACRSALLKKGAIGEQWFTAVPVKDEEARKELELFGNVDKRGCFFFDYTAKYTALEWIKVRANRYTPKFTKRNAHHYAVNLDDLGMVIIEKLKKDFGPKPWLVRYRLPDTITYEIPFGGEPFPQAEGSEIGEAGL